MIDPIAEMLTKIRNAQLAGHDEVTFSLSKIKLAIAQILEKEGFVDLVSKEKDGQRDSVRIKLKNSQTLGGFRKTPMIQGIKRVSHEGCRVYVGNKEIKSVKNNYGLAIISTSKGVMTGEEARKLGLGGEYICQVW